ncbi:hypothetical protein L195_g027869 [Trifolium pratense]|uniref:Uncharacterized protein n=2 Tax=Trifolium pratense TaxID=57577 RepID=A0ACB0JQ55_TRIPR|nr:hypothetical protein L195_g027869 [Trifolium pratense]CAJ2647235.1 unnamed protein product [Trifolium pratense]
MEPASIVRRAELRSPLLIPREVRITSSHDSTAAPSRGCIHDRLALYRCKGNTSGGEGDPTEIYLACQSTDCPYFVFCKL